jgi:hypothetical protein
MAKIGEIHEDEFWKTLKETLHIEQNISYHDACNVYSIDYSKLVRLVQVGALKRTKVNGICYVNRKDVEKLLQDKKLLHKDNKQ